MRERGRNRNYEAEEKAYQALGALLVAPLAKCTHEDIADAVLQLRENAGPLPKDVHYANSEASSIPAARSQFIVRMGKEGKTLGEFLKDQDVRNYIFKRI